MREIFLTSPKVELQGVGPGPPRHQLPAVEEDPQAPVPERRGDALHGGAWSRVLKLKRTSNCADAVIPAQRVPLEPWPAAEVSNCGSCKRMTRFSYLDHFRLISIDAIHS